MGLSVDELDPPLDDIAFLSRSNNRMAVLRELGAGTQTRRELRDELDISQPTIGRILDGFADRGWVANGDRSYHLTPLGELTLEAFGDLMDTVEIVQTLGEIGERLPLEELDFDLRLLADATVTRPSPTDATAHTRREQELAEQASEIRFFCNSAHPHTVQVYRDRVVEDGQRLEAVIAGDAMDAAGDHPEMAANLQDLLAADRTTIYRYDGIVPVMVGRMDDVATIIPLDENGVAVGLIETANETIRAWVDETIDRYRAEAVPMTDDIPAD